MGGADHAAVQAREDDGAAAAAGQADALVDLGDGSDLGVLLLVARHEQDLRLVGGVDRQRDGHAREDDGVF